MSADFVHFFLFWPFYLTLVGFSLFIPSLLSLALSDSSHHRDSAASVVCPAAGLSLAAAAAQGTGGDLHQNPCYDRYHTHTHTHTHLTPAQNDQWLFVFLFSAKSRSISLPLDLEAQISSMLSSSALNSLSRSNPNYKSSSRSSRPIASSNPWDYKNIIEKLQVSLSRV